MTKSCATKTIRIKKANGKIVTFSGRSGGSKAHGGACAPKRPSAKAAAHRREIGRAARACRREIGKPTANQKRSWATSGKKSYFDKLGACVSEQLNG